MPRLIVCRRRGAGRRAGAGAAGILSAHPHFRRWTELYALVCDGLAYATGAANVGTTKRRDGAAIAPSGVGLGCDSSLLLPTTSSLPQSPSSGARSTRDHKKKSKKNKKAEKKASGSRADSRAAQRQAAAAAAMAAEPPNTKNTAAGGGGRWVHVTDA